MVNRRVVQEVLRRGADEPEVIRHAPGLWEIAEILGDRGWGGAHGEISKDCVEGRANGLMNGSVIIGDFAMGKVLEGGLCWASRGFALGSHHTLEGGIDALRQLWLVIAGVKYEFGAAPE